MPPLLLVALLALGLLAGMLINYLADVLPATLSLTPALCRRCQTPLTFKRYLLMQPCPACGAKRAARAWILPPLTAAGLAALALIPGLGIRIGFWASAVLWIYFLLVAIIDIEHRLILLPLSLLGALLCGTIGVLRHGWPDTLLGGLAGYGIMIALVGLGELVKRGLVKLRRQATDEAAFGTGDATLGGVLGLLLGWPEIITGLILAILLAGAGALVILVLLKLQKKDASFYPFAYGPFLLMGAALLIF